MNGDSSMVHQAMSAPRSTSKASTEVLLERMQQRLAMVCTLLVTPHTLPDPPTHHLMQMDTNTSTSHEYLLESLQWATVL